MAKKYADASTYEAKLARVMERLGVSEFNYDWSRHECWVEFRYKGQLYRFSHSVEQARAHGIDVQYGSDAFAQVVLSLEDLARMVERGIYDLSTWVAGMLCLPEQSALEPCFVSLGFCERPTTVDEVKKQYRRMAQVMHPDKGGDSAAFATLQSNYQQCLQLLDPCD